MKEMCESMKGVIRSCKSKKTIKWPKEKGQKRTMVHKKLLRKL
jgi:hypothetical protein